MQNTQLQEVLQKLTKKDLKTFTDYLHSPYLNKKATLVQFWEAIKPFAPEFEIKDDQKENICKMVSGKPYNDAYYRNLCSDMLEITLNFLAEEEFHKSDVDQLQYKNEVLLENKLFSLMEKNIKNLFQAINKSDLSYTQKLNQLIKLDDYIFRLGIRRNRSKHENIAKLMGNEEARKRIIDYALGKLFLHIFNDYRACEILKKPFNYETARHYFAIYENRLGNEDKYVTAQYLTAKLIIEKEERYYHELKQMLIIDRVIPPTIELTNLLVAILDFLAKKVESGETGWNIEMFEIYDLRIKNNLWNLHADFAYTSLLNIVQNSLMLGKIEYAEQIVQKFESQISKNIREHVRNLCYAWISFYKGDLTAAHNYLLPIETENIVIKYSLRNLQVMIYFQNGEYQTLTSYLDSFKHFINYNSEPLGENVKQSGITLCNFLNLLVKLKLDPDQKNADKLKKEIGESKFLMKTWILQHLE